MQPYVLGEGTHLRIPFVTFPTSFDVRLRPRVVSSRTGTKDLQQVQISLRVLSRPTVERLPEIYVKLGEDFDERVLPSIVNEVLKATVAQYDAEQLLTAREKVSSQIRAGLHERAAEFGIILEDVSITHLLFSREFTAAIEQKQVAQQEAERSKFVVQKAEQERQAAVLRAEGEGQAAELISAALKAYGPGLIDVRRIDAAKEIAETLAAARNVVYVPGGGGAAVAQMLMAMPAPPRAAPRQQEGAQ